MIRVVVLGAGPAGLGAALELAEAGFAPTVIERQHAVGGSTASFDVGGVRVDLGSHRLHPAADPSVLDRLRRLLGDDLLVRPRHGRIRLQGRWIHFPLRPVDLALRLPPRFAFHAGSDAVGKLLRRTSTPSEETFADVLERGLGPTICREFYFPFARKIWGLEPTEISAIQARKRVSAGSFGALFRRLLPGGRGGRTPKGVFLYPRRGYGQICERLAEESVRAGATLALGTAVETVERIDRGGFAVRARGERGLETITADHVWSTIPVGALVTLLRPSAPKDVLDATASLETRAMVLVYLVLAANRFTEFDAHYFPEASIPFTRVSEPKNYRGESDPRGRTVLCAEIPCDVGDAIWVSSDDALGDLVREGLDRAGLPVRAKLLEVVSRRLPHAYPRYRRGYEVAFDRIDSWLDGIEGLLTYGRQGLFVHDNTHHALFMASAAVAAFRERGTIDREAWRRSRAVFATHVVED